jgi:hypothetical protein
MFDDDRRAVTLMIVVAVVMVQLPLGLVECWIDRLSSGR